MAAATPRTRSKGLEAAECPPRKLDAGQSSRARLPAAPGAHSISI
jgi:hypothetical protein